MRIDDLGEQKSGVFSKERDYQLVQLRESDGDLFPYEAMVLDDLFTGRTAVAMSDLKTTFASSMSAVQKQLYKNVTNLGWFLSNPQQSAAIRRRSAPRGLRQASDFSWLA